MKYILHIIVLAWVVSFTTPVAAQIGLLRPVEGAILVAGSTFVVAVDASKVGNVRGMTLISSIPGTEGGVELRAPQFSRSITLPSKIGFGAHRIWAIVQYQDGRIEKTPEVSVYTAPRGSPAAIRTELSAVQLRFRGDATPLNTYVRFGDGSEDKPARSGLLRCKVSNAEVASFQKDCARVIGLRPGKALATVEYAGLNVSIPVIVLKSKLGDLDGNGFVDEWDLNIVSDAEGEVVVVPGDARDLNKDGRIDMADVKYLSAMCSRPKCAVSD